LSGGPGKGKTMLSIFLAEELERCVKESQDALFVQYFCDNKDERRNTAVAILRGLIWQLLKRRPQLKNHILPSFKDRDTSQLVTSFDSLWRIFETMVRDPVLGTAYCVLDGLDECDEASLEWLLKKFKALFSTKSNDSLACRLNLIAVSRDLPDFIPDILSSFPRIRLDPDAHTEISSDICRFIKVKVDELSTYRHYPEPLRVHVKDVFLNRAKGTFLWVGIVANELRKYTSSEVKNALEQFPSGLEALYARMLLQISRHRQETAAKILRWVVMAFRPLTLSELSVAIEPTIRTSVGLSPDEVIRDQVTFCGYFLTIKQDEVELIHQSAKDYLLRKTPDPNRELEFFRIEEEQVNSEIVRRCLAYLQNGALADGAVVLRKRHSQVKDMTRLKAFPLLSYAILHWPEHARSLTRLEDIFDLSHPFYTRKSPVRESWLNSYWAAKEYTPVPSSFSLLHLASYFGIVPLARNLLCKNGWMYKLKHNINVNKRDSHGKIALQRAALRGHETTVRVLLEKGADVDARDSYGQTALQGAASGGHEATVRLLLEKGADVDVRDKDRRTTL
jgi:Ankyrin repeats (3 copies)/NACHT domain